MFLLVHQLKGHASSESTQKTRHSIKAGATAIQSA